MVQCELENISLATYHKLQKLGLGPEGERYPGMSLLRITPAARREWHERNAARRKSGAAKLEEQRRSALAAHAGTIAAASPLHVSKRGYSGKPEPVHKAEAKVRRAKVKV